MAEDEYLHGVVFVRREGATSREARLRVRKVAELEIADRSLGRARRLHERAVGDAVGAALARPERTGRFAVDERLALREPRLPHAALHAVDAFVTRRTFGQVLAYAHALVERAVLLVLALAVGHHCVAIVFARWTLRAARRLGPRPCPLPPRCQSRICQRRLPPAEPPLP